MPRASGKCHLATLSSGAGDGGGGADRGDGIVVGGWDTGDWDLVVADAGGGAGIASPVAGGTCSGTLATCRGAGLCRRGTVGCGLVGVGETTGGGGAGRSRVGTPPGARAWPRT